MAFTYYGPKEYANDFCTSSFVKLHASENFSTYVLSNKPKILMSTYDVNSSKLLSIAI